MTDKNDILVWYAAYGSNLLRERFMAYIEGGSYSPGGRPHPGCRDKHPPLDEHTRIINGRLFFSRSSRSWGGGVAFLEVGENFTQEVYCRCYLVTLGQFTDIACQENGLDPRQGPHLVDRDQLSASGSTLFVPGREDLWYNRIIMCANRGGYPVFTITSEGNSEKTGFTKPGDKYLLTIMKGLAESWGLDRDTIIAYLEEKAGICGMYERNELARIAESVP